MEEKVLVIAGFDPSGGAGVLSDCRSLNLFGHASCAIISCNTAQNDEHCYWMKPIPEADITGQLNVLLESYQITGIKIGAFPNLHLLSEILLKIRGRAQTCPIVWDPVLKPSSGNDFINEIPGESLENILTCIDLITPNAEENKRILKSLGRDNWSEKADIPDVLITSYLKTEKEISDLWISRNGQSKLISTKHRVGIDIHGSGCKFSSAILAGLVKGDSLGDAISGAKRFMEEVYFTSTGI